MTTDDIFAERRADRAFVERLATRMREDAALLDRIARGPATLLADLPMGLYIGANRYDTDDEHVLHLWTESGQSFDVRWPRHDDPTAGKAAITRTLADDVAAGLHDEPHP